MSGFFTHTLPARVPSPAKRDKGALHFLCVLTFAKNIIFQKVFALSSCPLVASARLALRIVGRSSPFPVRPLPPVALSSSRSSALPVIACPVLLCAPLCGVLYFCREKQGRRLQKPRAVAQKEKRGRSRSFTCFYLLATCTASPLDVPGLPVLLLPSCFNVCKGCGKSPAFCSGNSPGCPRFVPSLCEKSAFGFWSAAPCGFRSSSPRLSVSKTKQARPGRCCPCAVASGSVFDVPRRCWLSRLPGCKSAGKIAVFLLGKLPGKICAAQLLREKPAFDFASTSLCIFPAGAMRNAMRIFPLQI